MDTYRVGGAVRDTLLGLPVHETDWVVVGSTPKDMIKNGFTQVGRDFPVFLHPESKEEYALARTERKSGPGYRGFVVHADPSVTLEEDLERRDLTVNAMAMDESGSIIDPFGGLADLHGKILRHVSPHFVEDPLRVLRVARFASRYHHLGFIVAKETAALMAEIVDAGELPHLSTERIWIETEKALGERHPEVYWQVLSDCGAMTVLLPELAVSHGIAALGRTAPHTDRTDCRWAALLADLPETRVEKTSERFRAPNTFSMLAACVSGGRGRVKTALKDASECMALLKALDALRREEPFEGFCETLVALEQNSADAKSAVDLLRNARNAAQKVKAADITDQSLVGAELGAAMRSAQIERIARLLD